MSANTISSASLVIQRVNLRGEDWLYDSVAIEKHLRSHKKEVQVRGEGDAQARWSICCGRQRPLHCEKWLEQSIFGVVDIAQFFSLPKVILNPSVGGCRMEDQTKERWYQLCALAAVENDSKKLLSLVTEINCLLEMRDHKRRLPNVPHPGAT